MSCSVLVVLLERSKVICNGDCSGLLRRLLKCLHSKVVIHISLYHRIEPHLLDSN